MVMAQTCLISLLPQDVAVGLLYINLGATAECRANLRAVILKYLGGSPVIKKDLGT